MKTFLRTYRAPVAALGLAVGLAGCLGADGPGPRELTGTLVGGAAGGYVGSRFGDGRGKVAMTALGAVAGALFGQNVGRRLDDHAEAERGKALVASLEHGEGHGPIAWSSPSASGTPASGTFEATRSGTDRTTGRLCREFRQTMKVGDED